MWYAAVASLSFLKHPLACVASIILLVDLVSFSVFLACSTACNSIKLFFWSFHFPEFTNWNLWKSLNLKVDANIMIKVKGKLYTVRGNTFYRNATVSHFVRRKYLQPVEKLMQKFRNGIDLKIAWPYIILQLWTRRLWKGKSQSYSGGELELGLDNLDPIHRCLRYIVLTFNYMFSMMKECGEKGLVPSQEKNTACFLFKFFFLKSKSYFRIIYVILKWPPDSANHAFYFSLLSTLHLRSPQILSLLSL